VVQARILLAKLPLGPGRGGVKEHDQEEDCARDVDEGVDLVGPPHEHGMGEEPLLERGLDKDAEVLLEVDYLQRMFASGVDRGRLKSDSREGTAKLVDLGSVSRLCLGTRLRGTGAVWVEVVRTQ